MVDDEKKKTLVRILLSSKIPSRIKTTWPTNEVFLSTYCIVFVLGHVLALSDVSAIAAM